MEIEKLLRHEFVIDNNVEKQDGGEATVSKAWHPRFGEVAIKEWTKAVYSIENEIELLIKDCNHPNIIQFVGMLMNHDSTYIGYIMPYMPLGSLEDGQIDSVIHNKKKNYDDIYTDEQKMKWMTQVCYGLSHLHFKKIIHRDIKPSNILLGNSYNDVKLSDFGMGKSLKDASHTSTRVGTKLYMAPEIMKDEKYNFSADIYSLSITIWEILHRRRPYSHMKCSNLFEESELLYKICNGERPQLDNDLSKEVAELLMRCWNTNASNRPTIQDVLDFFNKTKFGYTGLHNAANECTTSFKNLNVHNSGDEVLTQTPLKTLVEKSPEKQTILLLGGDDGMDGDSLLMLENNGQNWKELNIKLPYAVSSHGAQFLNNHLYIFGGSGREGLLNCTYKLSKNLQWEKMANMNQKRCYISNSSVILNNQIWVCGGDKRKSLKSVEMYDPLRNKWKKMKEMNESRLNPAAAVVNGKIFISGGWSGNVLDSVECYDSSSNVWTLICNMPLQIWGHGAVEMNGKFILIGGDNYEALLKNVWALNTMDENAVWIDIPSMSIRRRWFSIAKIDSKVFVCGGYDYYNSINSVEVFDGKVWRDGPNMPTSRFGAPAVVIPMSFARDLEQFIAVPMPREPVKVQESQCSVQ